MGLVAVSEEPRHCQWFRGIVLLQGLKALSRGGKEAATGAGIAGQQGHAAHAALRAGRPQAAAAEG